jgi:hypothetical protein
VAIGVLHLHAGDLQVAVYLLGADAPVFHLDHGWGHVDPGEAVGNALVNQGSVINPGGEPGRFQGAVGMTRPLLPPVLEHRLGVPVAGFLGVEPFPVGVQPPHGRHDVGVGIGRVLEVIGPVRHHAQGDQFVRDESPDQGDSLVVVQFNRHGHFHFPGHLGVHPLLA